MKEAHLAGIANASGFQILDENNGINLKTEGYHTYLYDWLITMAYFKIRSPQFIVFLKVIPILFYPISILVSKIMQYKWLHNNNLKEWHSCEHKLIWLIESGKEMTIENLEQAPEYDLHCGTGSMQKSFLKTPSLAKLEETLRVGCRYNQELALWRED